MFSMPGHWELLLIVAIILVLFGGGSVRDSLVKLGRGAYRVKKEVDEIRDLAKK